MIRSSNQLTISERQINNEKLLAPINLVTLTNTVGLTVTLSDLGAAIWSVTLPSSNNSNDDSIDVVLNYKKLEDRVKNPNYFGVTVGRIANRIGGASFSLAGKTISLIQNDGKNQLHGGPEGISTNTWQYETKKSEDAVAVIYRLSSAGGEQGFPGNLEIELEYRLNDKNELSLSYKATTDQTTPVCLTNHAYWNIAGTNTENVLALELQINANKILSLDEEQIPDGKFISVKNSAFDFNQKKEIGKNIGDLANGYDHYYIANRKDCQSLTKIASLRDPSSGREMEILTTELGLQFYSGNFLDGSIMGAQDKPLARYMGLCLETHSYPNAVNHSHFPSVLLNAGEEYRQTTVHRFINL